METKRSFCGNPWSHTVKRPGEAGVREARGTTATHRVIVILIPVVLLFALLVSACPLYNPAAFVEKPATGSGSGGGQAAQAGPSDVTSSATQVTLSWNVPTTGAAPVSYIISYRAHGASTWTVLATIPASSTPSYTVQHSATGAGSFDFAVTAVDSVGNQSALHSSLDPTANPTSGWYLTW